MALTLIHLRRLILLLSIVYLAGEMLRRLFTGHDDAPDDVDYSKDDTWMGVPWHLHWWAYIYTCYVYAVVVNYVTFRHLNNLLVFEN
ncbi:uncharacterized protein Dwil_GK17470 [Drosophila willistoni]|uniref:Uncharacterized protein n=1 Tax=Drosophila willistoni TaxID=7260 RepID=B4MME4_DROWI|nr:uncharacterized protein LOC6638557 [Drosophila willistoni]EDW73289.1 uncharacterized protein Dwil_GK17470 [Drosophila willistoni]